MKVKIGAAILIILSVLLYICWDRIAWRQIQSQNTVAAYQKFINDHPGSSLNREAKFRIEKLHFDEAVQINSVGGYRKFVKENPQSTLVADANNKIHDLLIKDRIPALRNANTAEIILKYSGSLSGKINAEEVLKAWLGNAGFTIIPAGSGNADLNATLSLSGTPLGLNYTRGYRYTGGILDGEIILQCGNDFIMKESFHNQLDPPGLITMNYEDAFKDPQDAPFQKLLDESDFRNIVARMMVKAIGTQALVSMLEKEKGDKEIPGGGPTMDEDTSVRLEAGKALVNTGKPAVEPLLSALKNTDNEYRGAIIGCLGQIKDERAVPDLMKIYESNPGDSKELTVVLARNKDQLVFMTSNLHNIAGFALWKITGVDYN